MPTWHHPICFTKKYYFLNETLSFVTKTYNISSVHVLCFGAERCGLLWIMMKLKCDKMAMEHEKWIPTLMPQLHLRPISCQQSLSRPQVHSNIVNNYTTVHTWLKINTHIHMQKWFRKGSEMNCNTCVTFVVNKIYSIHKIQLYSVIYNRSKVKRCLTMMNDFYVKLKKREIEEMFSRPNHRGQ